MVEEAKTELELAKAKLKAAKEAREEAELKRLESIELQRVMDELANEERALKEDEIFQRFESQLGPKEIRRVDTDEGMIVVKRSLPAPYKRFSETKSMTMETCEALVKPCLLYPDKAEFNRIVEREPHAAIRAAAAIAEMAGVRAEGVAGK